METTNESKDLNLNQQINAEIFKKSAALKEKNNIVQEKLNILKQMADELFKNPNGKGKTL